jgi:hypothetical protein
MICIPLKHANALFILYSYASYQHAVFGTWSNKVWFVGLSVTFGRATEDSRVSKGDQLDISGVMFSKDGDVVVQPQPAVLEVKI